MRKLYAFIVTAVMLAFSMPASALSYDLPQENTVLQSDAYNMELYQDVNFYDQMVNGVSVQITFNTNLTTDAIKFNNYVPYQCETDGLTYVWAAVGNIGIASGYGLRNTGSGPRGFLLSDMKKGQIIVLQGSNGGYNTGETDPSYNGFCIPNGSNYSSPNWTWRYFEPKQVEDISDEIHEMQKEAAKAELGDSFDESTFQHDGFLYLRVLNDGWVSLPVERGASIQGFQIWADATADEYVTPPVYTMKRVDYTTRYGEVKEGASSKGKAVSTWYSFDGTDPIFLKQTDEVESEETVDVFDDEGTLIGQETIVTYKKVLDPSDPGIYGENQYFADEELMFDENDDYDGDGFVELKIATVSESGKAYSEIVTYKVNVNTITLNPPTLTLVGIDGIYRSYQIGWTNNTLCQENFWFKAECDGEVSESLALGDVVTASDNIKVTVEAYGYENGEYELTEVLNKGVEMFRKNKEKAEAGEHDWDFVITDDNVKKKIRGEEVLYCYLEEDPDTHYTAEEYEIGESNTGIDLSGAIPVQADYGWDWDGKNNRAGLRVLKTQDDQGNDVALEGGVDLNGNGFGYAEDKLGIVNNNGLSISCPPNTKNNGCILQYVDRADGENGPLGIYFMSRPTLTFDRTAAEFGDFVLVYQGQGGSNYTNSRWPSVHEVPGDALLSFQLANNGVHLFYIDVFTSEKGEDYEDPYVTGVNVVPATTMSNGFVYTLDGRIIRRNADTNGLQRGMYILNGKKILVK